MDSVELANSMTQLTSGDWEVDIINRGEILLHVLAENDLVLWSAAALRGEFEEVKNKPFASAQDCRHQRTGAMPSQNASMVEVKTQGGSTPLHSAERYGQVGMVEFLLGANANINAQHCHGLTPLHCAAYYGHTKIISTLLFANADVSIRANDGCTPLHDAAMNGHVRLSRYFWMPRRMRRCREMKE